MAGILILIGVIILFILLKQPGRKKELYQLPANTDALLLEHVDFYRDLDDQGRASFRERVQGFLSGVSVTGIGTEVEDLDRLLIASGAIIPIFAFPGWQYNNISEVLVYKDTFSSDYRVEGDDRSVLGMVGDGALNRQMIISKPSLRSSFRRGTDGHNTVIHEFVHLIDKADGAVDGIPEYLLAKPYIIPWVRRMRDTIAEMRRNRNRDIDPYGATNEAEFFAVMAEYFFERPEMLKERHPELYEDLAAMFGTPEGKADTGRG